MGGLILHRLTTKGIVFCSLMRSTTTIGWDYRSQQRKPITLLKFSKANPTLLQKHSSMSTYTFTFNKYLEPVSGKYIPLKMLTDSNYLSSCIRKDIQRLERDWWLKVIPHRAYFWIEKLLISSTSVLNITYQTHINEVKCSYNDYETKLKQCFKRSGAGICTITVYNYLAAL